MVRCLFGEEPDEVSPFHDEADEPDPNGGAAMVFQDEPDESEPGLPSTSLIGTEPDEADRAQSSLTRTCFQDVLLMMSLALMLPVLEVLFLCRFQLFLSLLPPSYALARMISKGRTHQKKKKI